MSKGNTKGRVVGQQASTPGTAEAANPTAKPQTPAEADTGTKVLDGLQVGLDVVGLIPGVGEVADLANAAVSAARGDWIGAGLSLASAIPFAGWGATAAKAAKRGTDLAKRSAEAAAKLAKEKAEREAKEKAAREAEAAAARKKAEDGGKVQPRRMKQKDVKCFKKNDKGDPDEYDRQLADQERGLNDLTVKEYLEGRDRYEQIGRKGTGAEQAKARAEYSKELTDKYKAVLNEEGITGKAAQTKAAEMAAEKMSTLAALHNPDMIAGGKDVVTAMGDKGVNSSIGAQWKDRAAELDKAAREVPEHERGDSKMNAKLKRCK